MLQIAFVQQLRHRHKTLVSILLKQQQQQQQWRNFSACQLLKQKRHTAVGDSGGGGLQRLKDASSGEVSTDVRPLAEKVKENTKTASYTLIILAGVGVTGFIFYTIMRELFSSLSPHNIYSDALERVKQDTRVQDAIGYPIKGFGEESRRGRRQHVAHQEFERHGVPHLRMQFYVQGIRNKATVHLETRETREGKLEYRYLFVQLNGYPHTTIVLEDNRTKDPPSLPATITPSASDWPSSGWN